MWICEKYYQTVDLMRVGQERVHSRRFFPQATSKRERMYLSSSIGISCRAGVQPSLLMNKLLQGNRFADPASASPACVTASCVVPRFRRYAMGAPAFGANPSEDREGNITLSVRQSPETSRLLNSATQAHILHTKPDQKSEYLRAFQRLLLIEQISEPPSRSAKILMGLEKKDSAR